MIEYDSGRNRWFLSTKSRIAEFRAGAKRRRIRSAADRPAAVRSPVGFPTSGTPIAKHHSRSTGAFAEQSPTEFPHASYAVSQAAPPPQEDRTSSSSPSALNPAVDTNTGSNVAGSANVSEPLKPCPPAKKVVHNGGSDEPKIQLSGGTDAEHAAQQGSTEQLTLATEENLKQIAGRQLSPSQQEMVNQIKEFMQQSKTAVAAGEVQRGHSLALKARLLSDELVKP